MAPWFKCLTEATSRLDLLPSLAALQCDQKAARKEGCYTVVVGMLPEFVNFGTENDHQKHLHVDGVHGSSRTQNGYQIKINLFFLAWWRHNFHSVSGFLSAF